MIMTMIIRGTYVNRRRLREEDKAEIIIYVMERQEILMAVRMYRRESLTQTN
jgi:hypothetical protein